MRPPFFLLVENVRSLHNVGAMFRTADAMGVTHVYLCGYTAIPPRTEITKVSLGAEKTVPWTKGPDIIDVISPLKKQGVTVAALEQTETSVDIEVWPTRWPLALIVGNEVDGVSARALAAADIHLHIPMDGQKESLNVSVAAGIALASLRRRRPA